MTQSVIAERLDNPSPKTDISAVVQRVAIMFEVRPDTEAEVARILSGYPSPEDRIDDDARLISTTVFMHGTWVVRISEFEGDLFKVMRYLGTQPVIQKVEADLNPYLVEPRDLESVEGVRSFYERSFMKQVTHRAVPSNDGYGHPRTGPAGVSVAAWTAAAWAPEALDLLDELGILDRLARGPERIVPLAASAGVDPRKLGRLLRALAALDVVRIEGAAVAIGSGARFWRSEADDTVRSLLGVVRPMLPENGLAIACKVPPASGGLPLDAAVPLLAPATAHVRRRLPFTHDFSAVERVVEIAGDGRLVAAILRAHPAPMGTVYASPVQPAPALQVASLAQRVDLVSGTVEDPPPPDADVYLLPFVLPALDDADAARLLASIRPSMAAGSALLIAEPVFDLPDSPPLTAAVDVQMLRLGAGRLRTEAELRSLLEVGRLNLTRVVPLGGTVATALLEAVPG